MSKAPWLVLIRELTSFYLERLKMSIGTQDSRTDGLGTAVFGPVPGLFDFQAHNRYEIDGSMAYECVYPLM